MKRFLFAASLVLVGCQPQGPVPIKADEVVGTVNISTYSGKATNVLETKIDGHDIWYMAKNSGYKGYGGLMHSPECEKCKVEKAKEEAALLEKIKALLN